MKLMIWIRNLFNKNISSDSVSNDSLSMHHVIFSNKTLLNYMKSKTLEKIEALTNEEKNMTFNRLWFQVCRHADFHEACKIYPEDIKFSKINIKGYPALFVKMPKPLFTSEAFFIAVVVTKPANSLKEENDEYRYFVLEKAEDSDGKNSTFFCEWQSENNFNMDEGPKPNKKPFLESVKLRL